jgi:hypothetical protein
LSVVPVFPNIVIYADNEIAKTLFFILVHVLFSKSTCFILIFECVVDGIIEYEKISSVVYIDTVQ